MYTAVEVDADAQSGPARFSHCGNALDSGVDFFIAVDVLQFFGGVHLHGQETLFRHFPGGHAYFCGPVAPDPRIHFHFIARQAAEQLVNGCIVVLSFDVPQRLVDAGNGAHQNGAAAIKTGAVHHVPVVFYMHGIFPQEVFHQFVHRRFHGGGLSFDYRLAPAGNAGVGFNFQEQPAGRHLEEFVAFYFHNGNCFFQD